ncbi:MAG: glyoxalase, partial [Caldilinea sp.]|nr:glyoxalase [Caldilinea sp.]
YHHHLGLNTWAGIGAPPPPPTAARLLDFQLVVPSSVILAEIIKGLHISGIEVNAADEGWSVLDPSGNRILLNHLN